MSTKEKTGFSDAERAAMKERAKELKAESRAEKNRAKGEEAVREKLNEMPKPDRILGERIHEIVTENAPSLLPKTWYGMPAYANEDGKVVCFFTAASKFEERYASFGFNPTANLDDGAMWPTAFAVKEMTPDVEKRIAALVKKAVS